MIRRLVEASGRPLTLSLAQGHGYSEGWRRILGLIEESADNGMPIKAQIAPRPIGVLLGLQGSANPFITYRAYAAIKDKPLAEKVKAMRDPSFRTAIMAEAAERENSARGIMSFERMFALGNPPNYEPPKETSIAAQAARSNRSAADIAYDLLLQDEGRAFLFSPFANYANYNLDHCGEMIAHKDTVMGLGDGGAHVGLISDASFITYLLTHWGRDRAKGKFDLGYLVKRQTQDTARAVGLYDRGLIAPGMKGDINVIDMNKLEVKAPSMAYDLPAGGKRLLQGASGYDATIVSGQVIYRNGQATNALPGKLIRGPQGRAN
jgi:N-acyl-D-aspartate/D-glutamate deacylase